jgi:queuosine precursor transporter
MNKDTAKHSNYYHYVVYAFIAVLLISNIASVKLVAAPIGVFDAGTILFPIAYIIGDILTEVYGYAAARRAIWSGFLALGLMVVTLAIVEILPAANEWDSQMAFEEILGFVPRIALASMIAYLVGEFINSYILAKLKIFTKGAHLWLRTIGSTIAGQGIDTIIFTTIAFYGLVSNEQLITIIITVYVMKVGFEVILTPLTYKIINYMKKKEGVDYYDKKTSFNPFRLFSN